ncbi:hypothetical protein HDU98_000005 [Podochytrium sp. JEL0797]|nr:hypothetical protein HDU98_000005 [Podochytrium sp. JEL0797]
MPKPRSIATATNAVIKFPWRPTIAPPVPPSTTTFQNHSDIPKLARFLLNPLKKQSSRFLAHTIASTAFNSNPDSGCYFNHEFVMGVEQAVPKFCSVISKTDPTLLTKVMTGPLLTKFKTTLLDLLSCQETATLSTEIRSVRVKNIHIRYGLPPPQIHSYRIISHFEDGSILKAIRTQDSRFSETDFIYEWGNLSWIFPRRVVLADEFEMSDEMFSEESQKVMETGFSVVVETKVDADVSFRYAGKKVLVEEGPCRRRDVSISWESSVIKLEDAKNGKAEDVVEWKVANIDGCV